MKEKQRFAGGAAKNKKRIGKRVGNVVVAMLAISISLVAGICIFMFDSLVMEALEKQCTEGTNVLSYEISRASEDEDKTQMLDNLKQYMDMEFTIFDRNIRSHTTIFQNGKRAIGTQLSVEIWSIIQQGKTYVGRADILGVNHVCSYVPLFDESGQVTGVLFSGLSSATTVKRISYVVALAVAAAVAAIVICILILIAYLKKNVTVPLTEITKVAKRLEQGDLGLASGEEFAFHYQFEDEVGDLSHAFEAIIRRLRSYIGEIDKVLGDIARGDLTSNAVQEYIGDFSSIKQSLDGIEVKLNDAMHQIAENTNQVAAGSDQLSSSSQALAQGAAEQASTVEELSAAITEISDGAKSTAAAAEDAGQSANQASRQLDISVGHMRELNETMERISASSEEIGKIITSIENIAFQTNILALNAAVEAARAGTAGKGFAVVADEVRNLANKVDEAAKATKGLIDGSIQAVREGGEAAEKVTVSLDHTSEATGQMTAIMSDLVRAVEGQAISIEQITEGISQISAVVQTNSATSQECAAASEELNSQTSQLKELLSTFRMKRSLYQ